MNERFFVLLYIDSGMVSLRPNPVGQLFFEPDKQGRNPLHWLCSCHYVNALNRSKHEKLES